MKKLTACLLTIALGTWLAFSACAEEKRIFVDSVGREVALDADITRIAVTGPLAQIVVFALAPDMLVGVSEAWDASAAGLIDQAYLNLPVLGQLYGGKGSMNLETLLASGPQVIIDVGETKANVRKDLDALSEQTGIPFVHIAASLDTMDETYAMLGRLLGKEETAHRLSVYCREAYGRMTEIAESVDKVDLMYITGEKGLNVIAKGSYHSEAIDLLVNNLAVVDAPSSRGTGNEVDMEQLFIWNPEFIVFSAESVYDVVKHDPLWQSMDAISYGMYVQAPVGPYNWMGFPPSAQRLLGMMWLAKVLYPETAAYDLYEETARYFELFYHCELTRAQFDALTEKAFVSPGM